MASNVDSVLKLFETPDKPDDLKAIRNNIPRQEDPLLQEIMGRESRIVEASMKGPSVLEATLKAERFQTVASIKLNNKRKAVAEIPVWKQVDPSQMRMCMDHDTWKVNAALIKNMKTTSDPRAWPSYTTNFKTCTSVLTPQDATFCGGSRGALVYLSPTSPSAIVAAAPCDVVSPSETYPGNTAFFQSARETTRGYCADQFKYAVAFDLVRNVKTRSIHALQVVADPAASAALAHVQQKGDSIFDRKFYSLGTQQSNLEIEIDQIIAAIDTYPALEKEIGYTRNEFVQLKQRVHDYLDNPTVVQRSVQNKQTTGWELSSAADPNHPLLPTMRSAHLRMRRLDEKLVKSGIAIPELSAYPGVEDLDQEKAKEFIDKNKEQFRQQIQRNAVAGYTVTEAVNEKVKRQKTALQHLDAIETKVASVLARATSPTTEKRAKKLQAVVSETKAPVAKLYTEIQLQSKKLRVSGFGIKKEILAQIQSPIFEVTLNQYWDKKEERKQVEAQLNKAELELTALKASPTTPEVSIIQKESEIAGLKVQKVGLEALIGNLQADPALAAYRLMNAANKRNLACFVHYGE